MLLWLLFPAITMSLGWGLRGFIGGGPLGAMIPGAMVALALCLLLGRSAGNAAVVAALAAVGVGFGGQETYGNTIQLAVSPEARIWGLAGLTLKGAVWGLMGGGVIGLALERGRVSLAGLLAMGAGTWVGWWFVNVPRSFGYFSIDRGELWAGLALGALALLAVERSALAWRFALVACMGGGFGFGFGGWLQVWGRWNAPQAWVGWWKVMEFWFGFWFGWALGWSAWKWRSAEPAVAAAHDYVSSIGGRVAAGVAMYLEYTGEFRFVYTLVGAALMAMVGWRPGTAWAVGLTMTAAAFVYDLFRSPWAAVMGLIVLTVRRGEMSVYAMLLALTWCASAVATAKALWRSEFHGEQGLFLLMGLLVTECARRAVSSTSPSACARRPSSP